MRFFFVNEGQRLLKATGRLAGVPAISFSIMTLTEERRSYVSVCITIAAGKESISPLNFNSSFPHECVYVQVYQISLNS